MIRAAGIDLGGTKCEVQLFDENWNSVDRQRVKTPAEYSPLVDVVASQVQWAIQNAGSCIPIGIGAAGLIDKNGNALTANLPATGKPLPKDIERAAGQKVSFLNDCRALAISEAMFGAGKTHQTVMALILGTGVGGGVAINKHLLAGQTNTGGEYGHIAAAGRIIKKYDLPIYSCGCGREGCVESYISGPGLGRIATHMLGQKTTPEDISGTKATDPAAMNVWRVWCDLTAELMLTMVHNVDPDCIVLGGGLSQIVGVANDLHLSLQAVQIPGFDVPPVLIAQGGDTSGARGAAFAAF